MIGIIANKKKERMGWRCDICKTPPFLPLKKRGGFEPDAA